MPSPYPANTLMGPNVILDTNLAMRPGTTSCRLWRETLAPRTKKFWLWRYTPSYNIAALKCQIGLRYSSSDSILNPFSEAETDGTMLERQ